MLRRFTITSRMIFLIVFMILFSISIALTFMYYMRHVGHRSVQEAEATMHAGYERSLQMSVDSFATQLSAIYAEAKEKGEDAELAVRMGVRHARYGTDGYYFIYDMTGKTIALPVKPSLYGTNRMELKDKRGNFILKDMIKAAKAGGGFSLYWYPKPGEEEPSPKKAYMKPIEGTNMFVGTGVYVDDVDKERDKLASLLDSIRAEAETTVGIGLVLALICAVLPMAYFIIKSILVPLRKATENAKHVAEGNLDLQVEVVGKDEITRLESALSLMINTLADNIKEIEEKSEAAEQKARDAEIATSEAEQARAQAERAKSEGMQAAAQRLEAVVARVAAASDQISSQSEEIRQGTLIQSERISSTATAMEEMNATVLEVAQNSGEAASVGQDAKTKAQSGAAIVQKTIAAMQVTQKQTLQLKENMGHLGQQAEAIGTIMTVIEDIADQTNLLALNAAIEAARAGEAGRGFAVVADEVRKLAEKTMGATKEVGASISAIQDGARSNIQSVEQAVEDMDKVVELTAESGEVLEEIVHGVEVSSDQIQSIATAAEQQSATSEEINQAIEEINRITTETSQGVSQTAEAVGELTSLMAELANLVQELKES